jgi:hypothetical protein
MKRKKIDELEVEKGARPVRRCKAVMVKRRADEYSRTIIRNIIETVNT